jgi:hypothetical protein
MGDYIITLGTYLILMILLKFKLRLPLSIKF